MVGFSSKILSKFYKEFLRTGTCILFMRKSFEFCFERERYKILG